MTQATSESNGTSRSFHDGNEPVPQKRPRLGNRLSGRSESVGKPGPCTESVATSPSEHCHVSFTSLPTEIRLMIWEYTWPAARVIEAASCEKFDDGYKEYTVLRPVGFLETLLQIDFTSRNLDDSLLEDCPPPVTLWVCHESRVHTLKQYTLIQHPRLPEYSFYFNSHRDLLWLSYDVTSESELLNELQTSYEASLDQFKTLLVEDSEWDFWDHDPSTSPVLPIFPALQTVRLFPDDFEDDSTPITYSAEEYRRVFAYHRNNYSRLCESKELSRTFRLEYIDRAGNSY